MRKMTEAEAKTKWCPFARQLDWDDNQAGGMPISANRHFDGSPSMRCLCLGSACMAWRWVDGWGDLPKENWPTANGTKTCPDPRGRCGLAP